MSRRFLLQNSNLELIEEVLKDPQLSLRAKGMFCIISFFHYRDEITLADIQSKCSDSKYVIIAAIEELKIHGLIAEG